MLYDISVVIVQYNPIWDKLRRTIESTLRQKDINYEIVIADDGSKDDLFLQLQKFFEDKDFKNYKLVKNVNNQGTVKNVISGLEKATGKYVRVIAPGDCLYCSQTLRQIVDFMNQRNAKEMFGKLAGYSQSEENMELVDFYAPIRTDIYESGNNKDAILKGLLSYGDNISGAAYSWERLYYLSCLKKIEGKVIYLEDCVNSLTILEDNKIEFLDKYVTWYEHGTGVSTSSSNKWLKLLSKDWENYFLLIDKRYPNNKYIKRGILLRKIASKGSFLSKIFMNILFLDRRFYFAKANKKENEIPNIDELTR